MVRFPHRRRSRARLTGAAALSFALLGAAVASPATSDASGDHSDLRHRKSALDSSISAQKRDVDQVSKRLLRTNFRLVDARDSLRGARFELSAVETQVRAAVRVDERMQEQLDAAVKRLRDARDDLAQGRSAVRTNRAALAAYAVTNYQSGDALRLGIAFQSESLQEALDNLQAADTVLNKQSRALQKFQATSVLLKLTAQRVQESKVAVADQRAAAAAHLMSERALQGKARIAKRAVQVRVDTLRSVRVDMVAAKRSEKHRLKLMQRQRDRVEARLQAIADRRARRHARELARQQAAKSALPSLPDRGYLSYPVRNTYVTSPYGMRIHPILKVPSLHDGTDLHAPCGSPVYAPADGRVVSAYFSVAYGNRLLIDNGFVEGVSLSTAYNHLSSYVATVGERVKRGDIIAYAGNTGWSTACHLHFTVYVNGGTVDPLTWL